MKSLSPFYTIESRPIVITSSPLYRDLFIRDTKSIRKRKVKKITVPKDPFVEAFFASHKIFRKRIRDLGNLEIITSDGEADAMRIMLAALIDSKKLLGQGVS